MRRGPRRDSATRAACGVRNATPDRPDERFPRGRSATESFTILGGIDDARLGSSKLVRPGGIVILDNMLRHGRVLDLDATTAQ
jgi:hypothetical protein